MKPYLITALWAWIVAIPAAVDAQKPVTPEPQPQAAPIGAAAAVAPSPSRTPAVRLSPATIEGQPIERRPPEKSDNRPAFPQQTRAPYHASAPFKVTTLIDNLPAP